MERIDLEFIKKRPIVGQGPNGYDIWGPVSPPEKLGIQGTYVAVDQDLCIADGACIDVCEVNVFEWASSPGHPLSEKKSAPVREKDCLFCTSCESVCPSLAIAIRMPAWSNWQDSKGYAHAKFEGGDLKIIQESSISGGRSANARELLIPCDQIREFKSKYAFLHRNYFLYVYLFDGSRHVIGRSSKKDDADHLLKRFQDDWPIAQAHAKAKTFPKDKPL